MYLETIRALDGEIFHLEYHQWRLAKTLAKHNLQALLNPPKKGLYRCRVLYDLQNIQIEYIPYTKRSIKTLKLIYNDDIEYEKKYSNRSSLDELFALRAECDEILIVKSGLIRDTSIANVAFFDGSEWITPRRPLLEGTTRERLLREKKIVARDVFVDDLAAFRGLALMNAMVDFDIIHQENIKEIIC